MAHLKALGKLYSNDYSIDGNNQQQIEQLIFYFMNDKRFYGDLQKGLLLRGIIGTGKSILMKIFSEKRSGLNFTLTKNFLFHSVIDIFSDYTRNGFSVIENHSKYMSYEEGYEWRNTTCFDELGMESTTAKNYGNTINIMESIIAIRYNNWQSRGQLTHFTTNLTPDEIEAQYGPRIRSRIAEMCNDIILLGIDRRRKK